MPYLIECDRCRATAPTEYGVAPDHWLTSRWIYNSIKSENKPRREFTGVFCRSCSEDFEQWLKTGRHFPAPQGEGGEG